MGYQAFSLTKRSKKELLKKFPPKYPRIVADHITYKFGVGARDPLPQAPKSIKVVGHAAADGVEAVVVEVNGKTQRPDGLIYHITLSLDIGKKPVESNTLLKGGWDKISPFDIDVKVVYNK